MVLDLFENIILELFCEIVSLKNMNKEIKYKKVATLKGIPFLNEKETILASKFPLWSDRAITKSVNNRRAES